MEIDKDHPGYSPCEGCVYHEESWHERANLLPNEYLEAQNEDGLQEEDASPCIFCPLVQAQRVAESDVDCVSFMTRVS